jgi:hypothetical protein
MSTQQQKHEIGAALPKKTYNPSTAQHTKDTAATAVEKEK